MSVRLLYRAGHSTPRIKAESSGAADAPSIASDQCTTRLSTEPAGHGRFRCPETAALENGYQSECDGHAVWHLPARIEAASAFRRLLRPCLDRWQVNEELVNSAVLIVTELVANAVLHGVPPILVLLSHDSEGITLTVHDAGTSAAVPTVHRLPLSTERGRGLHLVAALADGFALTSSQHGTFAVARLKPAKRHHHRPGGLT
ncbi:ATP-binding protein [Streptomyces sp. NPDC057909]|uniref:ATP-binding protein n=1 Tax=Streptomyces sp. NPDC057909 TaxID=3346277 RepID=UPI0036E63E2E